MATAEQIKSLIRSHCNNDQERFLTIALQVAAYEARKGHSAVALDIQNLVEKAKQSKSNVVPLHREFSDLLISSTPDTKLHSLVADEDKIKRIKRVISEFHKRDRLRSYGLTNRRKILLAGPPGTGKTMTASVLAGELKLPLYVVRMDKLITKYMGETSAQLRKIFDLIKVHRGVFLFDEFDAIGAERGRDNDVGEMRRVVNAFLQMLEQDDSLGLIIAATNDADVLDHALFRRFDDILYYQLPTKEEAITLIKFRLGQFKGEKSISNKLENVAEGLSHAEIGKACDDAIKDAILNDDDFVDCAVLEDMLNDRRDAYRNVRRDK